jgi:2-amino-4-hydroxy-6-hydroxymethyldihydropteridine diphosphokinase
MSDDRRRYVVGLGANLGDRLASLRSALAGLAQFGTLLAVSDLYETDPIGPAQPDFLNAAVLLESLLAPTALLEALLRLEKAHGRERRERWGPRSLDLDLLYSPDLIVGLPELTLPHPELMHRAFALAPLVDVAADARDPKSGAAYAEVLAALGFSGVRRLETAPNWCAGRAE